MNYFGGDYWATDYYAGGYWTGEGVDVVFVGIIGITETARAPAIIAYGVSPKQTNAAVAPAATADSVGMGRYE